MYELLQHVGFEQDDHIYTLKEGDTEAVIIGDCRPPHRHIEEE